MTRAEAYAACKRALGTADALSTLDALGEAGLVSDLCIEPRDVPTCDLVDAADALRQQAVAGQRTLRATQPDVSVGAARKQFLRVQRGAA